MNFLITLSCCRSDAAQCLKLLKWVQELNGTKDFDLLLSWTPGAKTVVNPQDMILLAREAFRSVRTYEIADEVLPKKLKDDRRDWSPNNVMFRRVAEYVTHFMKEVDAFYFMEPDVIPLIPQWANNLKTAYLSCGKPFMGARRPTKSDSGEERGTHMNGSGVYPKNFKQLTPTVLSVTSLEPERSVPWDVATTNEIQPHFRDTDLICVGLTKEEVLLSKVPSGAILYHGDKSGSLIPQLRERLFGVKPPEILVESPSVLEVPQIRITTSFTGVHTPEEDVDPIEIAIQALKCYVENSPTNRIEVRARLAHAGIIPKASKAKKNT